MTSTAPRTSDDRPRLSVLIVGYRMPEQLANTVWSFGPDYQQGVCARDYEIVVVENRSDACLPDAVLEKLPANTHYFLRDNESVSPISAIEFGLTHCRGRYLGLVIDGAQLVTPGVIRLALEALDENAGALVAVPGYHLGEAMQHEIDDNARLARLQAKFLATSGWKANGYRLFLWACFSPGNKRGFLEPMTECNVFFCSRARFDQSGALDRRFQYPGGGAINLHMYRLLGLQHDTLLEVLPGEGTFHQYHEGVTTRRAEDMQDQLASFRRQLQEYWGNRFAALRREPSLRGEVGEYAGHFFDVSLKFNQLHLAMAQARGKEAWEDDLPENLI